MPETHSNKLKIEYIGAQLRHYFKGMAEC